MERAERTVTTHRYHRRSRQHGGVSSLRPGPGGDRRSAARRLRLSHRRHESRGCAGHFGRREIGRRMSHNSFGHFFRVTTFGESHGPVIGCVVDGCPPGIPLVESEIQADLDRRRPGQSKYVSQRKEPDLVRIVSGVFEDDQTDGQVTTGTPIALLIDNVDARAKDYSEIRDRFRPGHADYTYWAKYGVRDYRGGGRQSARETASRVAAGATAAKLLNVLYADVRMRR